MNFTIIIVILVVIIIYTSFSDTSQRHLHTREMNRMNFHSSTIFPQLENIQPLRESIIKELNTILEDSWKDWPEQNLYDSANPTATWKIYPFYAFGVWATKNCERAPIMTNFIKSIPNMKLATLSKLSPGMKLTPHRGWGNHSNHVLRCHYGLIVPDNCLVRVNDEVQYHKEGEWLVFDDSETHMAENMSDRDRIVLIVDIERPDNIPKGTSEVGDTEELLNIVNYFKNLP